MSTKILPTEFENLINEKLLSVSVVVSELLSHSVVYNIAAQIAV